MRKQNLDETSESAFLLLASLKAEFGDENSLGEIWVCLEKSSVSEAISGETRRTRGELYSNI